MSRHLSRLDPFAVVEVVRAPGAKGIAPGAARNATTDAFPCKAWWLPSPRSRGDFFLRRGRMPAIGLEPPARGRDRGPGPTLGDAEMGSSPLRRSRACTPRQDSSIRGVIG